MPKTNSNILKPAPELVLVADDELLTAVAITDSLVDLGYEVVGPASSGEQAITLASEHKPDIAILDIRMPGLSGLDAARTLWLEHAIPTIMVSAYSDDSMLRQAQSTGIFGYLIKPVSREALRVTMCIGWARAATQISQSDRIKQLDKTLENRRLIEQAKWALVESTDLSEAEAHSLLQRRARETRQRLADIAQAVLDGSVSLESFNTATGSNKS